MKDKLILTKQTLEFLLSTNDEINPINNDLENVIKFLDDELKNAIGL